MIRLLFLICLSLALWTNSAQAISDDILLRQEVEGDIQPPSTPTLLSAVPVASSQIDLSWSSSTDDVELGGYRVFRDSVHIATTTLTTYSDTGLTPSTAYSYFVQAFDTSMLVSTSSNALSTTTPASATSLETESGSSGSQGTLELLSLEIAPAQKSAQISWETNRYVQFELRWGRTASYELGFITSELFLRTHTAHLSDLEPGTTYEYQLVAYDRRGRMSILATDRFKTLPAPDQIAPANVSGLRAQYKGEDIVLSWVNPKDPDFSHVRVVRSHLFYPTDPYDGFIAYQGRGEGFTDAFAAETQMTHYYSVFSYDQEGNVSSGSVVKASKQAEPIFESTKELNLNFSDIEVVQEGKPIAGDSIDAHAPFIVRIAYEKLPEHLKTVVVTLSHPTDHAQTFSFLLRVNKDKTYYEATIGALMEGGVYQVGIAVFDHHTQKLTEVSGAFTAIKPQEEVLLGIPLSLEVKNTLAQTTIAWALLLLFILVWLYVLLRSISIERTAATAALWMRVSALGALFISAGFGAYMITASLGHQPQLAQLAQSEGKNLSFEHTLYLILLCLLLAMCALAGSAIVAFLKQRRK